MGLLYWVILRDHSSGPTGWGSWNCSRSDGPYGPPCVVPRPAGHELTCYDTCPQCDPVNTCDWSACLDDILFVREDLVSEVAISLQLGDIQGSAKGGH